MRDPAEHCCRHEKRPVIGIDEVGRGCLAGHVSAAAVWFPDIRAIPDCVDDSKRIPEGKRDAVATAIRACAVVSIGHASVEEIDRMGIFAATQLAMARAWTMLQAPKDCLVIVDGNDAPPLIKAEVVAIKGADARCPSVAAASVIAKVDRDQTMRVLAGKQDPYGWRKNKGYGTGLHLEALLRHGPSAHHRRSFAPVRQAIRAQQEGMR